MGCHAKRLGFGKGREVTLGFQLLPRCFFVGTMRITTLLLLLSLAGTCCAASEKVSAAATRLKKAITEENAKNPAQGPDGSSRQAMAAAMAARIDPLLAREEAREQLIDVLAQIATVYTSEAVRTEITALQLAVQEDQEAQDKQTRVQLDAALTAARQAVEAASSAQDLDKTIQELSTLRKPYNSGSYRPTLRRNFEDISSALQWANRWQDYLAAKESGNNQAAANALQQLANMESGTLMPRSRILKLAEDARKGRDDSGPRRRPQQELFAEIDKAMAGLKTLDDAEPVARQLREISGQDYSEPLQPLRNLIAGLEQISRCYQNYKAGLPTNIPASPYGEGPVEPGGAATARLHAEILLLVIPRYVGAPEGTTAKPGEKPDQLLARLADEANARGDFSVAQKAAEARRILIARNNPYQRPDTDAFGALIAAQNQEKAGQYMFAVISYQTALAGGSDAIPAKQIGERLAALQSGHPKEYEMGIERYLVRGGLEAGRFPARMPGMRPQDLGPQSQGALAVPAAPSPAPASPPAATPPPTAAPSPTAKE